MYDRRGTRLSCTVLLCLLAAGNSTGCIGIASVRLGWEVRTSVLDRDSGDPFVDAKVDIELFRNDERISKTDDARTDGHGAIRAEVFTGFSCSLVVFPFPIGFPPNRALGPPPNEILLRVTTADTRRGSLSVPVAPDHIGRYNRYWLRPMFGHIELPPVSVHLEPSGGGVDRPDG